MGAPVGGPERWRVGQEVHPPHPLTHPRVELQVRQRARQQRLVRGGQLHKVRGVRGQALAVQARRRAHRRQRGRNLLKVCGGGWIAMGGKQRGSEEDGRRAVQGMGRETATEPPRQLSSPTSRRRACPRSQPHQRPHPPQPQHPPGSCSSRYSWDQGNSAEGTRKKWMPLVAFHSTSASRSAQLASASWLTRARPSASNVRRRHDLHVFRG